MRLFQVAAAVVLAAVPVMADDTYDLRGPAPTKGQVVTSKMTMTIKEAEANITVAGQKVPVTMTMAFTHDQQQEVVEVSGRQVSKVKEKVTKEGVKVKATAFGQDTEEDKPSELEGETVVGERTKDGKWAYKLVDGKPTDDQQKELKKRQGPENEDDAYPAEKVKVGHKWEVDASTLKGLTGNTMTDVKGKMKQHFVKVEKVDGEECAVIETTGKLTAKMQPEEDGDPAPDVEMTIKATGWKSLKTGLEVKGSFDGKIKLSGKQKAMGQEVEIEMEGPLSGESTSALAAKK